MTKRKPKRSTQGVNAKIASEVVDGKLRASSIEVVETK